MTFLPRRTAPKASSKASRPRRRPAPARISPLWLHAPNLVWPGYAAACVLAAAAAFYHADTQGAAHPLLLAFFFGLALLATLFPASGPRGHRVSLLPGVGLAGMLLLAPLTAMLPLLLAGGLYAVTRDTASSRRAALARGALLATAALAGAWALHIPSGSTILAVCLYGAAYFGGQAVAGLLAQHRSGGDVRLDMAAFGASVPAAILMAMAFPALGVAGVAAAAGLMAMLLVIAHFGFEVSTLREQVRAMEKLSAVALAQTTPGRVVERFLQLTGGLMPYDRACLWLTDDSQTRLERIASRQTTPSGRGGRLAGESDPAAVRFGEGLVGRVADRQSALIVRDGSRDPRTAQAEERGGVSGPYSLLLLPLVAGGETVGVAQFERDAAGGYSARDEGRVNALASQAAATIANVRMHRDIYNQSITDGLTGLFNRRHMQAALVEERQRAMRYGRNLSVIMLDVDGFKSYNDTYGHPQGDVLLQMLASLLRANVREVDVVGRYGGEEFVVLMPETSKTEAIHTAERLRTAVATTVFPGFPDDPDMAVFKSISLGVATFPQDADEMSTLVQLADQALYRAKTGGRNQVVAAVSAAEADVVPVEK